MSEADDPSVEPFPDVVEQPPEDLMPESVEFEILELEKDTAETVSEGDVRVEGNPDAGHEVFFEAGPEAEGEPGPSCSCRIQGTRSSDGGPGGLLWIALLLLGLLSLRRAKPNQVQRTTAK